MKAGAFIPATPTAKARPPAASATLNEGGGFHPRNPADLESQGEAAEPAQ